MFFSRLRVSVVVLSALCLLFAACSRAPRKEPERIVVLPFENLTSDASLNWLSRGLADVLAVQAGATDAANTREAQLLRATTIVQGYFVRDGQQVRVYARVAGKMLTALGEPAGLIGIGSDLVRQMGRQPASYPTSNAQAVQALYSGDVDRALALDPQFGNAHLERLQAIARSGDRAALSGAIEAAKKARYTELGRARLELLTATTPAERIAALQRVAESSPADPALWRTLAELQMQVKRYKEAAGSYARVLESLPADEAALNSRGYALMYAGDLGTAVQTLERYAEVARNSANPSDSLGEVYFWFGKYEEAARHLLAAHEKDPSAGGGYEPFRAAYATYLHGKAPFADESIRKFLDERAKSGDKLVGLRRHLWIRMTGRRAEWRPQSSLEQSMASLLALYDGDRGTARTLAESARKSAAMPAAVSLASVALLLSEPSAPADVWRSRVASAFPRPEQAPAARQLLGFALLLDRKYEDAVKVWQEIYDQTPGLLANEPRMALAWAQQKPVERFLPPASLDPGLSTLLYMRAMEKR